MLTRADEPLNFHRMHWRLIIDSPSEGVLDIGKPSRVISFFLLVRTAKIISRTVRKPTATPTTLLYTTCRRPRLKLNGWECTGVSERAPLASQLGLISQTINRG
jgi:hypothetical protein